MIRPIRSGHVLPLLVVVLIVLLLGYKVYRGIAGWKYGRQSVSRVHHSPSVGIRKGSGGFFAEAKDNLGLMIQGRFLDKAPNRAEQSAGIMIQSGYSSAYLNYYRDRRM